jgi:signal transduction histidine kinase
MGAGSLRLRLFGLGGVVLAASLLAIWFGASALFGRHLERRVGAELDVHLQQLAGALRLDAGGAMQLAREPADPRFDVPLGGLYWQASDLRDGREIASRSLWTDRLVLPPDGPGGAVRSLSTPGPDGARLLVHERRIIVPTADGDHPVRLAVGMDMRELDELRAGFGADLAPALAALGLLLLGGFALQVSAGLRPLARVRDALGAVRAGRTSRLVMSGPAEIAPLVDEVNALLETQERAVARGRDRAADLAHGLKTPLTALAADVRDLRGRGIDDVAGSIEHLAEGMRRHVERELARARIRHGRGVATADAGAVVRAVVRAVERTPDGAKLEFAVDAVDGATLPVDRDDLSEIVGNLVENAVRHAAARVAIRVLPAEQAILVEDDGPGIPSDALQGVGQRGGRLDSGGGAGLGLAIVGDIAEAYGAELALGASSLGGLAATVRFRA